MNTIRRVGGPAPGKLRMALARFMESLFSEGRVRVPAVVNSEGLLLPSAPDEKHEAITFIREFEQSYRNEIPGKAPELSLDAAYWAALMVYRASSFLAHRNVAAEAIRTAMSEPCPVTPSPTACYSVDITLRFLPDLVRLAKAVSPDDPLVEILKNLGREWPLSSVGIPDIGPVVVEPIVSHFSLRQLYVDRMIATNDRSRLDVPAVKEAVRATIGLHEELAPDWTASLATH